MALILSNIHALSHNASVWTQTHSQQVPHEKPLGFILGEHVLRPLIDRTCALFEKAKECFIAIDRALSLPVAEAAPIPIPQIEKWRQMGEALGDVVLTEDMIARIIAGEPNAEPKVVLFVKDCLSVLATIANPADFYDNLILSNLEAHVLEKIKLIDGVKKKQDQMFEAEMERRNRIQQEKELRRDIAGLVEKKRQAEAQASSKAHSITLIQDEYSNLIAKVKPFVTHYLKIQKLKDDTGDNTDKIIAQGHKLQKEMRRGGLTLEVYNNFLEDTVNPAIRRNNERYLQFVNEEKYYGDLIAEFDAPLKNLEAHIQTLKKEQDQFSAAAHEQAQKIREKSEL